MYQLLGLVQLSIIFDKLSYIIKETLFFAGDGTLSRYAGIELKHIKMQTKINVGPTGEVNMFYMQIHRTQHELQPQHI